MLGRNTPLPSQTPAAAPEDSPHGRRLTDAPSTGASTFGPSLHVRGSIAGAGSVRIAGQWEGPIEVEGLVHITEGARVTGRVTATHAVIDGELEGRLDVRGRVELSASARVRADIHSPTVAIAEGCFFDGRIHMGSEGERGPTHFREKRRRRGGRGATGDTASSAPAAVPAPDEPAPAPTPATTTEAPSSPAPSGPAPQPRPV
jgi:cytoskeletal protein CcmA (bactofilin family)